jgi:5'(3')-deoxyribonucleotidase
VIVYIDMDGVVVNLIEEWLRRYRLETGEEVYPADIRTWDTHNHVSVGKEIYDYLSDPGVWFAAPPYPGAIPAISSLLADGHKVYLATTPWWTNDKCYTEKLAWVDRWLPEIGRRNIIFLADKSCLHGNVLVDDKPENLDGFAGLPILFERPWNKKLANAIRLVHPPTVFVARSWKEVLTAIQKGGQP